MTASTVHAVDVSSRSAASCEGHARRLDLDDLLGTTQCRFASELFAAYRFAPLRRWILSAVTRLERGEFHSRTLREILRAYHGVTVGAYSYGPCLTPGAFPPGVVIGRYVSIAADLRVLPRNHPLERLSMHPLFYNPALGLAQRDTISSSVLMIEHDAWIGERAMILPGCHRIGLGAVVGAGAVVTHDVPHFAIVGGNPARLIRKRFSDATCEQIRASGWWLRRHDEFLPHLDAMSRALREPACEHPLLRRR